MTIASSHGNLGHILLGGGGEIDVVSAFGGGFPPGCLAYLGDEAGMKFFQYMQSRTTVLTTGALVSRVGDKNGNTAINNILSGSVLQAVTSGLTAGQHNGAIMWVFDNADSAGAAPEGEWGFIKNNTTTLINLVDNKPLTTALAINDDLQICAVTGVEAAAAGDVNTGVAGVVVAPDGLPAANWGWIQRIGRCRASMTASTAATINVQVIAGAGLVNAAAASSKFQESIGYFFASISSDIVSDFAPVFISCGDHANGGYSDQDAVV